MVVVMGVLPPLLPPPPPPEELGGGVGESGVPSSTMVYVEKLGTVNTRVPLVYETMVQVVHSTPSFMIFGLVAVMLYSVTVAPLFSSGTLVESSDTYPLVIDRLLSMSSLSPVVFTRDTGMLYMILPRVLPMLNDGILFRSALSILFVIVNFVVSGIAQP
jgi:hypothetical protein